MGLPLEPVYTPVIGIVRSLFFVWGLRFTLTGAENIPRRGGAVMMINHISYLDYMYAGLAAHKAHRVVRFMAKDAVFHHPISGPLMRGMKHIPVDRESGAGAFRAGVEAVKAGEIVGVFPEATISRSFELKEFKSGGARMAQLSGAPMIPVVVWGSQRVWTKGRPKRLGRTKIPIFIHVGAPIPVPAEADLTEVMTELRAAMSAMLTSAQQAYPPLSGQELVYLPVRLGGQAPTLQEASAMDAADVEARRAARAARLARKRGRSVS